MKKYMGILGEIVLYMLIFGIAIFSLKQCYIKLLIG